MSDLQIFNSEQFGTVRTVMIGDEPYFVGKDVAEILGYSNTNKAISDHVDLEDKTDGVTIRDPIGRGQKPIFISESGLYSLILSSKLERAKKFKRWVTAEVLPSIRKNGGYIAGQEELSPQELMAKALLVAQKTIADRETRISNLEAQKQAMQPKADYFDALVDRNLLTNFRETAKELGIPPKVFVDWLIAHKYIYRDQKGKLMPYAAKNDSLFEVKEGKGRYSDWAGTQTLITPKGRATFRLLCCNPA